MNKLQTIVTPEKQFANSAMLDTVMEKLALKNDAALSHKLVVAPPVVSKIRHGYLNIGSTLIIRIHELTDMPIADIKSRLLMGS